MSLEVCFYVNDEEKQEREKEKERKKSKGDIGNRNVDGLLCALW